MKNSNTPAMPTNYEGGLTKREHFAGLAMQAMLANPKEWMMLGSDLTLSAVEAADELLKALENTK